MSFVRPSRPERVKAAVATALVQALLAYALLFGLIRSAPEQLQATLARFTLTAPAPPPIVKPPPPAPHVSARKSGAASPPNLRATPTDLIAPKPVIPPPVPPPLTAALKAGAGRDASAGAAVVAGPGFGSGGFGDGSGGGGYGDGDGDGGSPPRQIRGRLKDSDYPREAGEAGAGGTVGVRYTVWTDGRVSDCRVTRSSGSRILDDTTCRLIRERFRFEPSRDEQGHPVPSVLVEDHEWVIHDEARER